MIAAHMIKSVLFDCISVKQYLTNMKL